jgi:sulfite reductase (NADPH) flavoprotein alpha-component
MPDALLVLYGTITGNAETCARRAAARLGAAGLACEVRDLLDAAPEDLAAAPAVLLCVSTYGEGDPPDTAAPMWEALVREGRVRLPGTPFAVLALGDRSYDRFCQCGVDFDEALARLGGERLAPRVDCDVTYDADCAAWIETVLAALQARPLPA